MFRFLYICDSFAVFLSGKSGILNMCTSDCNIPAGNTLARKTPRLIDFVCNHSSDYARGTGSYTSRMFVCFFF